MNKFKLITGILSLTLFATTAFAARLPSIGDGGTERGGGAGGRGVGNSRIGTIEDVYSSVLDRFASKQNIETRDSSPKKDGVDAAKIRAFIRNGGIQVVDAQSGILRSFEASRIVNGKLLVNCQVFQKETSQRADLDDVLMNELIQATAAADQGT